MTYPAPHAPAVPIRTATPGDAGRLAALETDGFDDPWSAAQLADEIAYPEALVLVAEGGPATPPPDPRDTAPGEPVRAEGGAGGGPAALPPDGPDAGPGFGADDEAGLTPLGYAAFRRFAGEGELLRIAVSPSARRRGVAAALLAAGFSRLAAEGVELCHLEVDELNLPAIRLYERQGFHRVGRRRGYYPGGGDALLYARALRPDEPPLQPVGSAS